MFTFPEPEADESEELDELRREVQARVDRARKEGHVNPAGMTRIQVVEGDVILKDRRCPHCHHPYLAREWAWASWNHQYVIHEECNMEITVLAERARKRERAERIANVLGARPYEF